MTFEANSNLHLQTTRLRFTRIAQNWPLRCSRDQVADCSSGPARHSARLEGETIQKVRDRPVARAKQKRCRSARIRSRRAANPPNKIMNVGSGGVGTGVASLRCCRAPPPGAISWIAQRLCPHPSDRCTPFE